MSWGCPPSRRAHCGCKPWLTTAALASPDHLVLKQQGERSTSIAIDDLRERADQHFHFFDPYEAEEIEVRGLVFRDFLEAEYGAVPERLAFTAWDDYEVTLGGWDDPNWICHPSRWRGAGAS